MCVCVCVCVRARVCVCVCVCVRINQPLCTGRIRRKVYFNAELSRFELSFPLPPRPIAKSVLLFTHSWKENSWFYTIRKDITAI